MFMKLWCLLLICLSCNLLRASADHFRRYRDVFLPHLLLAGVLAILLLSLRTSRISPVATSTTIATTNPQPRCNDGYTLYPGPGRSFCFRYFGNLRSWDSAQRVCQMANAELLVLDNESLSSFGDFLRQQFPTAGTTWLRAKTDINGIVRYIGGPTIPLNSPLWNRGEPNNPNGCVMIIYPRDRTLLFDEPCGTPENYFCQQF